MSVTSKGGKKKKKEAKTVTSSQTSPFFTWLKKHARTSVGLTVLFSPCNLFNENQKKVHQTLFLSTLKLRIKSNIKLNKNTTRTPPFILHHTIVKKKK
jgi:hypothetical protein